MNIQGGEEDDDISVNTSRLRRLYLHILDNCELHAVDVATSIGLKLAVSPTSFELTLRGDCAVAIVEVDAYNWSHPNGASSYTDRCVKQKLEETGRWQITGLPPIPSDGTRGAYSTPVTFWPRPDGGWSAEIGIVELLSCSDWAVRANQMEALRQELQNLNGTGKGSEASLSPAQLQVKRMQERMADRARRAKIQQVGSRPSPAAVEVSKIEWVCESCHRVNAHGHNTQVIMFLSITLLKMMNLRQ